MDNNRNTKNIKMTNLQDKLISYLKTNIPDLISRTIDSKSDYEIDFHYSEHDEINPNFASANFYTFEEESQTCYMSIRVNALIDDTYHCRVVEIDSDGVKHEYFEHIYK